MKRVEELRALVAPMAGAGGKRIAVTPATDPRPMKTCRRNAREVGRLPGAGIKRQSHGRIDLKSTIIALATLSVMATAAFAQGSDNSMNNTKSPGATGAMKTPTAPGVATDPQGVAAQQGNSSKASAGTVGAAPGASTQSQMPEDKSKH